MKVKYIDVLRNISEWKAIAQFHRDKLLLNKVGVDLCECNYPIFNEKKKVLEC